MTGRPTDYTDDKANAILAMMVEGMSLRKICAPDDMPDMSTVYRWMSRNPEFRNNYARAQQDRTTVFAEELLEIADQYDKSEEAATPDLVQRARLRIDTRKWLMSKMDPKRFGDKVETVLSGSVEVQQVRRTVVDPKKDEAP